MKRQMKVCVVGAAGVDRVVAFEIRDLTPGEAAALLATGAPWPAQDLPPTLDDLARQIIDWQAVTFPTVTAAASAEHLQREARELAANPADAEEAADVFLMLLSTVERAGIGLGGFRRAVEAKLAKNKARTWKAPDAHGVVEHEEGAGSGATADLIVSRRPHARIHATSGGPPHLHWCGDGWRADSPCWPEAIINIPAAEAHLDATAAGWREVACTFADLLAPLEAKEAPGHTAEGESPCPA